MADLPVELSDGLSERLTRVLDVEGKIPRALEALGPVAGRDVVLLDVVDGRRAGQLRELGARVVVAAGPDAMVGLADTSVDVIVSLWSFFRGAAPVELSEAERILRPGGRLLVVHDYGRDDVSHLHGHRPEYGAWSKRNGPFLRNGFRVRVVHCFWTFDSMDDCRDFLAAAFDEPGRAVATGLKRPRLSYNVAVYHRTFGELDVESDRDNASEGQAAGSSAPAQAPG